MVKYQDLMNRPMTNTTFKLSGLLVMAILMTSLSSQNAFASVTDIVDLSATAVVGGDVDLSWSASIPDGVTDTSVTYRVERSTDAFATVTTVLVASQAGLSHTDTTGVEATTYDYRVIPIGDSSGDGNASNVPQATPDATSPVITLTGANPQTIELGAGYTELGATADTGETVIIDASAFVDAVGSYSIDYDVTDLAGNVATTVQRTVNVVDTTLPVITLIGADPQTIELGAGYTELGANVVDLAVSPLVIDASAFVDAVGSYSIDYDSTDASGNVAVTVSRTVNVVDTTDPTFDVDGNTIDYNTVLQVTATYIVGSILNIVDLATTDGGVIVGDGAVDTSVPAQFLVTYTVTDASGNALTITETVDVVDTTIPIITLTGANPQNIVLGAGYTELGATASDISDGDISGSIVIDASAFVDAIGSYSVTYDVQDSSGNDAVQLTRTVNVVLGNPPTMTIDGTDQTIKFGTSFTPPTASCSDVEDGVDFVTGITTSDTVGSEAGSYTLNYSCTDSSGNTTVDSITITRDAKKSGSSCDVSATFGTPFTCDRRNFVENSVVIHGNTYDPQTDFHIENPRIDAIVGMPYAIDLKPYAPFGEGSIRWVGVSLGLVEGDFNFGNGEAKVWLHQSFDGTFTIEEDDPNNIIKVGSFAKSGEKICAVGINDALCPVYTIKYSYNQAPLGEMVGVEVVDQRRTVENRFFNDGITVTGISLNPSPVIEVLAKEKTVSHHYLTFTDPELKDRSVAVDENGNTWNLVNGFWTQESEQINNSCGSYGVHGWAKHCAEFKVLKYSQEQESLETMKAMYPNMFKEESFSEINNIFAYDTPEQSQREQTLQTLDWYNAN